MPLIEQQDIVFATPQIPLPDGVSAVESAVESLQKQLLNYPPCRIISIAVSDAALSGYGLVAVIETI